MPALERRRLFLGTCALGRAIDAFGAPLDGGPPLLGRTVALALRAPRPNEREPIERPLWSGVRVLDALLTFGRGARLGIFGPPGAGKSTLVESIVDGCAADAVVVGLAGERGREAQRWIARLDERTTIVCATSDRPASERIAAAAVAIAQARALCDRGLHVLFVLDSLARVAAAAREIAVAAGESVGRGGYPPSVFATLARYVECAGALRCGSVTLVATVLSDGDERDPVSEAARSLLDGHIAAFVRARTGRALPRRRRSAQQQPDDGSRRRQKSTAAPHRRCAVRSHCSNVWKTRVRSGSSRRIAYRARRSR